jgi:murein DD-endopeptidase MepM/ murein hydrolase activator NlpD
MPMRRHHGLAAGVLAALGLVWITRDAWPWRRPPLTAAPLVITTPFTEWADTLRRNETLSQLLARAGVTGADQVGLLAAARGLNVRRLRAGTVFHVRRNDRDSIVERVMVRAAPERRVWLRRAPADSGWRETVETIPWTVTRIRIAGRIESSLYEAIEDAVPDAVLPHGERVELAWALADVYDWEVDFTRDIRPGDRFTVVIDRLESPEGRHRFGRIWAARVEAARQPNYAFYFEADSMPGGFYDEQGRSLRRAFLRAPLKFRRISSRFGGRFHPVLKRWRSHQGVDYAAAHGTPVRATATGVVRRAGRDGGYGLLVELGHVNGIRTRYGHLSRLAVRPGARITQGETIGYVGSTGLSTGPHLHYEFLVGGRPTNPRRADQGTGTPVPEAHEDAFAAASARLRAQLDHPRSPIAVRTE